MKDDEGVTGGESGRVFCIILVWGYVHTLCLSVGNCIQVQFCAFAGTGTVVGGG